MLDNRTTIIDEIEQADKRVKEFLKLELKQVIDNPYVEEIISAHLNPLILEDRYSILLRKIKNTLN